MEKSRTDDHEILTCYLEVGDMQASDAEQFSESQTENENPPTPLNSQ